MSHFDCAQCDPEYQPKGSKDCPKILPVIRQDLTIALEIFAISFALNSYNLPQNLFFSHEQGRDAAAIEQIYKNQDLRLIGTKTEIEGFFSPPWYYYLMTIPYGFSGGSPIAASFFLIVLTSTTAPIIYLLARDLLKSINWAAAAGITAAFSWEIISYSRWLSNVTLAFPATALAYFFLYKYASTKNQKFFLIFAIAATTAAQFQITLTFQFLFVLAALRLTKLIKLPSIKIIALSIAFFIIVFSPLIAFDFKNQYLITKSLANFLSGQSSFKLNLDLLDSAILYSKELTTVIARSNLNITSPLARTSFFSLLFLGLYLFLKKKKARETFLFVLIISFMSLGIFIFNVGLTQLYQGTAIGWIILTTIALSALWNHKQTRIFALVLLSLLISAWLQNFKNLKNNEGFFFAPEQNVLRLKDQKALIDFMHNDAQVRPYRFESLTVPFLQSEGWQYLQEYYYPHQESKHSKLAYIAIEKNIPQFWEEKWIEDLGKSDLVFEKNFGQIRLQKRTITD